MLFHRHGLLWLGSAIRYTMFCIKNKKNRYTACKLSFSIYRSGVYGGIHIIDMLFLMLCKIFKFFSDSNVTLITKH